MFTPSIQRPIKSLLQSTNLALNIGKRRERSRLMLQQLEKRSNRKETPKNRPTTTTMHSRSTVSTKLLLETSRSAEAMPHSSQKKGKHSEQSRDSIPSTSAISALERPRSRSAGEGGDPAPSAQCSECVVNNHSARVPKSPLQLTPTHFPETLLRHLFPSTSNWEIPN